MGVAERHIGRRRDPRRTADVGVNGSGLLSLDERGRALTDGGVATKSGSVDLSSFNVADPDGIKTSFATSTSAVALEPSDFDGAVVDGNGLLPNPRNVTITLAASVGSYVQQPIKVSGLDAQGETVVETVTPTTNDGGETLTLFTMFVGAIRIEIPAQTDASGAFEIGVGASVSVDPPADALLVGTSGSVVVTLKDDFGHTITLGTTNANSVLPFAVKAVHSVVTAAGIRALYFG